jgi:hypothetical protein
MAAIRTASWGCVTKSLHVRYERCAPEMQMFPCRLAPASTHAHTHACVLARTRLRSFLKPVPIDSVVEFKLVGVTRQRDGRFARTHAPARSRVRHAHAFGTHATCQGNMSRAICLRTTAMHAHFLLNDTPVSVGLLLNLIGAWSAGVYGCVDVDALCLLQWSLCTCAHHACARTHRAATHGRLCRRRRQCSCGSSRAT